MTEEEWLAQLKPGDPVLVDRGNDPAFNARWEIKRVSRITPKGWLVISPTWSEFGFGEHFYRNGNNVRGRGRHRLRQPSFDNLAQFECEKLDAQCGR